MTFTKRQFVLYCNNELVGTRDNMLYQHKSVNKFWLPDFEHLKGSWAIEVSKWAWSVLPPYYWGWFLKSTAPTLLSFGNTSWSGFLRSSRDLVLTSRNITCLNTQGPHTVFTENKQYQDVGIFRKLDKQWNAFMEKKRIIDADHARQGVSSADIYRLLHTWNTLLNY